MIHRLRIYVLMLEMERGLAERRAARAVRSRAAKDGVHTYWQRAGERCRAVFG